MCLFCLATYEQKADTHEVADDRISNLLSPTVDTKLTAINCIPMVCRSGWVGLGQAGRCGLDWLSPSWLDWLFGFAWFGCLAGNQVGLLAGWLAELACRQDWQGFLDQLV